MDLRFCAGVTDRRPKVPPQRPPPPVLPVDSCGGRAWCPEAPSRGLAALRLVEYEKTEATSPRIRSDLSAVAADGLAALDGGDVQRPPQPRRDGPRPGGAERGGGQRVRHLRHLPLEPGPGAEVTRHPVLFHSPLFLAWEEVWFRISQPSDTVAAFASGAMWMLACWMVYLVALRLFTPSIGLFAVLLFLANASLLRFAVSGLPHLMAGFLLTGLLWSLAGPREENDDPLVPPWWSLVASGVFVGLAGLAEQTLVW